MSADLLIQAILAASTTALAVVAGIGLRQLALAKTDAKLRHRRAALEKAIEASAAYLDEFCALDSAYSELLEEKGIESYSGPIGNFTRDSLQKAAAAEALKKWACYIWVPALNKLESIAAMFCCGVADELLGFDIIGRTYCSTVENRYDLLSFARRQGRFAPSKYYENIVKLYHVWRPRLAESELEQAKREMDATLCALRQRKLPNLDLPE